ncbi:MAG: hypothetical protein HYT75_01340 [Deltaproteobacteria bacterium]|nr:hypothetical protein [Deltaproteobacteria bacterium]
MIGSIVSMSLRLPAKVVVAGVGTLMPVSLRAEHSRIECSAWQSHAYNCLIGIVSLLFAMTCGVLLSSCGAETTTGEDYGDLLQSPSGLVLTQSEHQYGWGKSDCTLCHNLNNIHISESEAGFDMAAVRQQVEDEGISACATCHGTNGVQ